MEKELKKLRSLFDALRKEPHLRVRLFLITKHLKDGVPKYKKVLHKYSFKAASIDLNDDLQQYFQRLLINQMEKTLSRDDIEMQEYAVIDEDIESKIYTYALNNALSFADIITNQLTAGVNVPFVASLKDIKSDLWAYCIGFSLPGTNKPMYSFRKITQGKIATDEKSGLEKFLCRFDTKDSKLSIVRGETINFDYKFDCIYFDGKFIVLSKKAFEELVDLDEEFKENAEEVIATIKKYNIVSGLDFFAEEACSNPSTLKKLANIAKKENHMDLDVERLKKMRAIAKRLDLNLKFKDGKLLVEDSKDVTLLIRLLDKYYVECMQTGEPYGSHSKVKLSQAKQ